MRTSSEGTAAPLDVRAAAHFTSLKRMATMLLVRHGQASWFEETYDRLSSVGEAQSRLLGEMWAARGLEMTRVFTGPRFRQLRSAELAGEAYAASGKRWPPPVVLEDLDEMHVEPLFREHLPDIFEVHAPLRAIGDSLLAADGDGSRAKIFDRLALNVMELWMKGQISAPGVETWADFRARVRRALDAAQEFPTPGKLLHTPSGRLVAMFTSAGVIGAAAQLALGVDDVTSLSLAWRIRNSSVSEFLFSGPRWTLLSYNTVPHLADASLLTYR
jgi:broad specificity phosphatase PhoE